MDDFFVTRPIGPNPGIWHNQFNANVITSVCILMLTTLVIYVVYLYRSRTRLPVGVRMVLFQNISDIPYNAEMCSICLGDFNAGDRLATIQTCKHVYHRRCIVRALARVPACPICRAVPLDGDD